MDIRAKRSREKIINTFLALRKKKRLEKITVTEISEISNINKSTFYAHFHDIYDLSDFVETQLVQEILSTVQNPENIINDKKQFTLDIAKAYTSYSDKIKLLFSGSRSDVLPHKLSQSFKEYVFEKHPEYKDDPEMNISLSYSIYGGFYAYNNNLQYGTDVIVKVLSEVQK